MSAVRTGTRLDHLYELRDRVAQEIQVEELRVATRGGILETLDVSELLRLLNVTAYTVKTWAVAEGLLPAVTRGRVSRAVVVAYAHAHPLEVRRG